MASLKIHAPIKTITHTALYKSIFHIFTTFNPLDHGPLTIGTQQGMAGPIVEIGCYFFLYLKCFRYRTYKVTPETEEQLITLRNLLNEDIEVRYYCIVAFIL